MTKTNNNNDEENLVSAEPGNFQDLINRFKQLPPEEQAQFAQLYGRASKGGTRLPDEGKEEFNYALPVEELEGHQEDGDAQEGNLTVMSHAVYQSLREALALNSFQTSEDNPWPTAVLKKRGGATGQAQLRPAIMDGNTSLISPDEVDRLAQLMWKQQKELSDLDADALDLLSHIWLQQAHTPNDKAVADVDQFLALRGLEQKHRAGGVRSGFDSEQRATMLKVLSHIQNIWLNIGEMEVYTGEPQTEAQPNSPPSTEEEEEESGAGARGKSRVRPDAQARRTKSIKKTIQSRAFVITDRIGQMKLDGNLDVERFIFQPGHLFSQFLFGPGRQTALLSAKAVQYDPYRQKWEKRLARYLSWQWRVKARNSDYSRPYKVATLLEAVGEGLNARRPALTRERLEKALDTLQADGVIASWHYLRWNEQIASQKGWGQEWLNATALIEPPEVIREKYSSLERSRDKGVLVGVLPATRRGRLASSGAETDNDSNATGNQEEISTEEFINTFRLRRLTLNISQAVAARQLGITQGYLSQLERHQIKPATELQKRIEEWMTRLD